MKLELPWPPSVNHYWFANGNRRFIGKKGKAYREFVYLVTRLEKHTPGKISLTIEAYPPDKRKRDLDNLPKCVLDSLVHANVIDDDSNIDELHIIRKEIVKDGKILVIIEAL